MTERSEVLSIAVAQPRSVSGDLAGNAERHTELVILAGARVVVFPELSLTGYELTADVVDPDDVRLAPLVAACRARQTVALAGAPVTCDGRDHIAILAIDGDGARVAYYKMWLGDVEAERFEPGELPAVLEVQGWRLGLAVCKDTGHPEHAAATAALGIDVYVSGVLEHLHDAHITAERGQRTAVEHGVWVATASFAGPTGGGYATGAGGSAIWRPDGSYAARLGDDTDTFAVATLT